MAHEEKKQRILIFEIRHKLTTKTMSHCMWWKELRCINWKCISIYLGLFHFPFFSFFSNVIQNKTVPLHFLQLSNNSLQLASKVIAIYVYNKSKQHPNANYVFLNSIQQLSKLIPHNMNKKNSKISDPIYIYIWQAKREGKKIQDYEMRMTERQEPR